MRVRAPSWVGACLAVLPGLALANGGPVAWGGDGPLGGVHPAHDTEVRLVSEDLRLVLARDAKRFRGEARYVLSNAGRARTVVFGVPVGLAETDERYAGGGLAPKELDALARRVRLELAGKRIACRMAPGAALADAAAGRVQPLPPPEGDPSPPTHPGAWCVAKLEIPAGEIPLVLAYDGELAFTDMAYSKSALVEYEKRTLRWALFPAGYWAGKPDRVAIRLDPGPFDGLVAATPAPTRTDGPALVWELASPDLKALRELVAIVDAEPVLRHRELVASRTETWLDRGAKLAATASSTLAPQGKASYAAANAVDREAATAWCAGKRGGAGEWLEVRVVRGPGGPDPDQCRLEGYALVPGYAKSQATWTGNDRLRAFRIEPCSGARGMRIEPARAGDPASGGGGKRIELTRGGDPRSGGGKAPAYRLSDRADRSALMLHEPLDDASCVRITIEEVERGAADDACISELRPVFNCG